MIMLFSAVIGIAGRGWGFRVIKARKEAKTNSDRHRQTAAELRSLAESINSKVDEFSSQPHYTLAGLWPDSIATCLGESFHTDYWRQLTDAAQRLEDAAKVLDGFAQAEDEAVPTQMGRDRGNAAKRTVALALVAVCRDVFGASLFGVVATILSVLFGSEIAVSTVRSWCSHPRE
jgi:hypothetical protein